MQNSLFFKIKADASVDVGFWGVNAEASVDVVHCTALESVLKAAPAVGLGNFQ